MICNRSVPLSGGTTSPEYPAYDPTIWGYIWRFGELFSWISPNIRELFEGAFGIFRRIALRTSLPDNSNWFCNLEYPEPSEHPRTPKYLRNIREIFETSKILGKPWLRISPEGGTTSAKPPDSVTPLLLAWIIFIAVGWLFCLIYTDWLF